METGNTYLITMNDWIYAPDGMVYKSFFGTYNGMTEDKTHIHFGRLNIKPHNIISAFETDEYESGDVPHHEWGGGYTLTYKRPTAIYNADRVYSKLKMVE